MLKFIQFDLFSSPEKVLDWLNSLSKQGTQLINLDEYSLFARFKKDDSIAYKYKFKFNQNWRKPNDAFFEIEKIDDWELITPLSFGKTIYVFRKPAGMCNQFEANLDYQALKNAFFKKILFREFSILILVVLNLLSLQIQPSLFHSIVLTIYAFAFIRFALLFISGVHILLPNQNVSNSKLSRLTKLSYAITYLLVFLYIGSVSINYLTLFQVKQDLPNADFVTIEKFIGSNASIIKTVSSSSLFSLEPSASYLVQFSNAEQSFTVYQTRQKISSEEEWSALISRLRRRIEPFSYQVAYQAQTVVKTSDNFILYSDSFQSQTFLSLIRVGDILYGLHTVNLSLDNHEKILSEMRAK